MKRRRKATVSLEAFHGQRNKQHKASSSHTKGETAMVGTSIPDSGSGKAYDVFLNFRGPDSRDTVIDVLHDTLSNAGVQVFLDNEDIRKGKEIEGEIFGAITNTRIYIPIFSKDYASSKWCLDELVKMMDCWERSRGDTAKVILPIFFDVDVKDVKLKSPVYTLALDKHKKELGKAMVKQWEDALKKVARIKGWNLKDHGLCNLADLIKNEVFKKLSISESIPVVPDGFVGIHDRIEDIMQLLEQESPEVRFIAIHGMGGIGKTTLAHLVYQKISCCFQGSCILFDVRGSSSVHDIVKLQKKLLLDTLKLKSIELSHTREGINMISQRLRNRKVLIVLDDVDKGDHLLNLAAESEWFGCGSRILVTTENIGLLDRKRYHFYEMKEMNRGDALKFFCQHAFRDDFPPDEYRDISTEIVDTTGGLPLAIRVIGSSLYNQCYETWQLRIEKLKEAPHMTVQDRLLISYKALEKEQREIFLDIACFFNNKKKVDPFYFWQACQLYPKSGIEILVYRCLIKVNQNGRLCMHNQLRDLGRAIAQGNIQTFESQISIPSRLWSAEVAIDVNRRQVADSIVALVLGTLDPYNDLHPEGFSRPIHLKFLQLQGGNFKGNFKDVLQKLAWLSWFQSPPTIEADNLDLKNLTVLKLSGSHIDEDWEGWGLFTRGKRLKVLHLRGCTRLKKTPDFSIFTELERLILKDCEALEEISSSITELEHLKYLKVSNGSRKLENAYFLEAPARPQLLPNSIGELKSLEVMEIINVGLTKLHPSIGELNKLKRLCLRCPPLKYLPNTVTNLTSLAELDICGSQIKKLPRGIKALARLEIKRDPVTRATRNTKVPE